MRTRRAAATCVALLALAGASGCHEPGRGTAAQATPTSASPGPTQVQPVPVCCGPDGGDNLKTANVDGGWQGTWTELATGGAKPHRGELTLALSQDGTRVTGTVTMQNNPCVPRASAAGTIKGTALSLTTTGRITVTLTGGVTNNASVGGTYTTTPGACGGGTWSASRP